MKMRLSRLCPVCRTNSFIDFGGIEGYLRCLKCGTVRLKSFPKVEYEENYYQGKSSFASTLFFPVTRLLYFLRSLYTRSEKNVWVDVGAGAGEFLKTVNAKRKIGVEVSSYGRRLMQGNDIESLTDPEFIMARNLRADVVSFWHVLEHVENPALYLDTARKNIVKNGKLVVGIPNIDSFEYRLFKKHWFHLAPGFHLWHFPLKAFLKLVKSHGFVIAYIDFFAPEHHLSGVLQSFINFSAGSENVLQKLVKRGIGENIKIGDVFWIGFWLTLGLPIVFCFWIVSSLFKKSGSVVVVAVPKG